MVSTSLSDPLFSLYLFYGTVVTVKMLLMVWAVALSRFFKDVSFNLIVLWVGAVQARQDSFLGAYGALGV